MDHQTEKWFKCAIIRVINKIIIFKSIYSHEIKSKIWNKSLKIFKDWIYYLELSDFNKQNYLLNDNENKNNIEKSESLKFKKNILDFLKININLPRNYSVISNYLLGSYLLDSLVYDNLNQKVIFGCQIF